MDGQLSRNISRKLSSAMESVFSSGMHYSRRHRSFDEDEEALKWAAIERLPTFDRLRTTIINSYLEHTERTTVVPETVDVRVLGANERQSFVDNLFKVAEEDNERFLNKFRERIDKVGIQLPTVEVRFENLTVEADCYVGNRALPTLPNAVRNITESALAMLGISLA